MAEVALAPGAGDGRFLSFRLGERRYALPAERVAEVIRVPAVARLPQSPKALLGLANLRGNVVPILSLSVLIGRPGAAGAAGRTILLSGRDAAGLVVDAVDGIVSPDGHRIETAQAALTSEAGERLAGLFALPGKEDAARILDLDAILNGAFGERSRQRPASSSRAAAAALRDTAQDRRDSRVLLTFAVAGQDFALPLESVREVVALPAALALMPRAEPVLLGIIPYRDGLLPLMSLRGLLGFAGHEAASARAKVLVVPVGGGLVGLVTERIEALLRADPGRIEPTPPMLAARSGGETRITAMLRAEGGRLISVLAPDRLFREDVMQRLGTVAAPDGAIEVAAQSDTIALVVFRIGDDSFALPIDAVEEVARVPDRVARVPHAPDFVEGVINLHGEVVPVIDQRKRFGQTSSKPGSGRLIVVRTAQYRAGLLVDSVAEVLRARVDTIQPAPELIGGAGCLVTAVATIAAEGRMVLLLEPDALLTPVERGLLDQLADDRGDQGLP